MLYDHYHQHNVEKSLLINRRLCRPISSIQSKWTIAWDLGMIDRYSSWVDEVMCQNSPLTGHANFTPNEVFDWSWKVLADN